MGPESGLRIEEIELGTGRQATAESWVLAEVRFFLNKGEEIKLFPGAPDHRFVINLKSRDYFAGLRRGIVGMSEGGLRRLRVSPHLAFGKEGVPGVIPPEAVVVCSVRLLGIVEKGFRLRGPYHRVRQVIIGHPGEAARNLPRWSFGIINDGEYGIDIAYPMPGMTWRHTRKRRFGAALPKEEADALFDEILAFPTTSASHVVPYERAWADMSEPAGNITRERATNRLCLTVSYSHEDAQPVGYFVREGDPEFQDTRALRLIRALLERPELQ